MNDIDDSTELDEFDDYVIVASLAAAAAALEADENEPPKKKTRIIYARVDYTKSCWWTMMENGQCKTRGHREWQRFRRRFGVSWERFVKLVEEAKTWTLVKDAGELSSPPPLGNDADKESSPSSSSGSDLDNSDSEVNVAPPPTFGDVTVDAAGNPCVPLSLKILGWLRMQTKGCSFDAISELCGVSLPTMHAFFHHFSQRFLDENFHLWIVYPKTKEDARESLSVYARLGVPGIVASTDCTHVSWGRCPAQLGVVYTGKEHFPSISYEVSCDHSKKVLWVTDGHPGSRNDITIIKADEFLQRVLNREILQDVTYELFDKDGKAYTCEGAHIMLDNGYPKRGPLQCPMKHCVTDAENRWSCRFESVRKDIEGFFGILKIRYRILRSRMNFQKQVYCDNVFKNCCILHNMNLQDDGLDNAWNKSTKWETEEAEDDYDVHLGLEALRSRKRSARTFSSTSEFVPVREDPPPFGYVPSSGIDGHSDKEHGVIQAKLITHFDILHQTGKVVWNIGRPTQPSHTKW